MRVSSKVVGAKALVWDWELLHSDFSDSESCYKLTDIQIAAIYNVTTVMDWSTRWYNRPSDFNVIQEFVEDIRYRLSSPQHCAGSGGGGGGGGGGGLPDWLCLTDCDGDGIIDSVFIKETEMTINVYIGCGCGCGDGNAQGYGSGSGSSNRTSGGDLVGGGTTPYGTNSVTPCDVAAYIIPYIFAQAKEWLVQIESFQNAGEIFPDAMAKATGIVPFLDELTPIPEAIDIAQATVERVIDNCFDDGINALVDTDLILEAQVAFVKIYGNNTQIKSLDRSGLRSWAQELPFIWGSVVDGCIFTPSIFFQAFVSLMNMTKVNNRLALAAGTSSSVFCEAMYDQSGAIRPAGYLPSGESLGSGNLLFENSAYKLYEIETGNAQFQIVGDELIGEYYDDVTAIGYSMKQISGTGFGNNITTRFYVEDVNVISSVLGGGSEGNGTTQIQATGESGAVTLLTTKVPLYAGFGAGNYSPNPTSGNLRVECTANGADWLVELQTLHIVIAK